MCEGCGLKRGDRVGPFVIKEIGHNSHLVVGNPSTNGCAVEYYANLPKNANLPSITVDKSCSYCKQRVFATLEKENE